jgi:hypothetical protein
VLDAQPVVKRKMAMISERIMLSSVRGSPYASYTNYDTWRDELVACTLERFRICKLIDEDEFPGRGLKRSRSDPALNIARWAGSYNFCRSPPSGRLRPIQINFDGISIFGTADFRPSHISR